MDAAPDLMRFSLLGPLVASDGRRREALAGERPAHLLVLLALAPGWLARAQVAETLWPRLPHATALRNLRKTLHRLRSLWWGAAVQIQAEWLRLDAGTDLSQFSHHLAAGAAADALALMRGPLAEGLHCDDPGDWLGQARELWLGRWRSVLLQALPALPVALAEAELQRLRRWDPHDEDLARAHLQLLSAGGRRAEFERVRADYARLLADDLGVDLPASLREAPPLPSAAEGFVGREDELQQLDEDLAAPGACVALVGVGGVGKTRLAAEVALRCTAAGERVVWLRLSDLSEARAAWPRLAALLGVDLRAGADPLPPLAAALSQGPALLVADNCEHLLDGAGGLAPLLAGLRAAAPALRLLATSREPPGLPGERVVLLQGLETPDPADPPGALLRNPAVRLFALRADRVDARFEARAEAAAIGRIARAADGHPLALELAAGWVRSQRCDEIAAELEAGLLPAASGGQDLGAVFDSTWQRLNEVQQRALADLAELPASFDRAAALAITGQRAAGFAALVDKALVDRSGSRWRLHPLWRAWLRQRQGSAAAAVAPRAARHFVDALEQQRRQHGRDGAPMLGWIDTEWPHLLAAWQQALATADAALLLPLISAFEVYLELRGRRDEALALLATASTTLPERRALRPLRLRIEVSRAALLYRAGRYDDAAALAEGVRRRAVAQGDRRALAGALRVIAIAGLQRGQLEQPLARLVEVRDIALQEGFDDLLPDATMNVAILHATLGRRDDAERGYLQVIAGARQRGARRLLVNALINLGALLVPSGRPAEARTALEEAVALARAEGLRPMLTHALVNLGAALIRVEDFSAAAGVEADARRSLDEGGEPAQANQVELLAATLARHGGRLPEAWRHAAASMSAALRFGQQPAVNALPMFVARLLMAGGERAAALAWLVFQLQQQPLWDDDRVEAEALLAQWHCSDEERRQSALDAQALSLAALRRLLDDRAAR